MISTKTIAIHPGEFIRREVLEQLGLNVGEAAAALGVTRPALSALLNAKASLSADMAIRIEKAFGLEIERLMHLQTDWDVSEAKKRAGDINVRAYRPAQIPTRQARLL
jgi:addiction module HigA family antidote